MLTIKCKTETRSHAGAERRLFFENSARWLAGFVITTKFFAFSSSGQAFADQVALDDPRIRARRVSIGTTWGKLACYLARPGAEGKSFPAVIVAHDKLGLTSHFEDIARRLALEGFVALAPDYASRFGGTPTEAGPALEVVGMTTWADMISDMHTAISWLRSSGESAGKVGAVGFGRGGTAINHAIAESSDLSAAVVSYGHPPPLDEVKNIKVPLLLNFAGKDQFIDLEIPGFVEALKNAGVRYEMFTYEKTDHGFDDDSAVAHYSPEAAKMAWSRTVAFLKASLG